MRSLAEEGEERNGDGVKGHLNLVWDERAGRMAPGRFGWKAEQPSVFQQTATAFVEDIGITSTAKPEENYTAAEEHLAKQSMRRQPEVDDKILADVVAYVCTLAVPARRDWTNALVLRGKAVFALTHCTSCCPYSPAGDRRQRRVPGIVAPNHPAVHRFAAA